MLLINIIIHVRISIYTIPFFPFPSSSSSQPKTIRIIRNRSRPIAKHAPNLDLLRQHIQHGVHIPIIINHTLDILVVVIPALIQPPAALKRPRDNVHARLLHRDSVLGRHDLALGIDLCQREECRCHDLDAALGEVGDARRGVGVPCGGVDALVEVHGLLGELGLVLDPVEDVVGEEALRVDAAGVDLVLLEGVDEVLGVLFLSVAVEWHGDFGGFELGGELEAPSVDLFDVGLECEERAAGGVEVGAEVGRAVHVLFYGGGIGVEAVHLCAQGEELVLRDVGGTAFGCGGLAIGCGLEGCGALCTEGGVEDVRRSVQIALRVAAHELLVFRESDIALENTGALSAGSVETFERVLRELEGCAAVGDHEVTGMEGTF